MSNVETVVEETAKKKVSVKAKKPAKKKAAKAKKPVTKKVAAAKPEVSVPADLKGKKLSRLLNAKTGLKSLDPKKDKTFKPWLYIARKAEKGTVTVEDFVRAGHDLKLLRDLIKEGRVVTK